MLQIPLFMNMFSQIMPQIWQTMAQLVIVFGMLAILVEADLCRQLGIHPCQCTEKGNVQCPNFTLGQPAEDNRVLEISCDGKAFNLNSTILSTAEPVLISSLEVSNCLIDVALNETFENIGMSNVHVLTIQNSNHPHNSPEVLRFPSLKELRLHRNNIKHLKLAVFSELTNLTLLDLTLNPIEQIGEDTFRNNHAIKVLHITVTSRQLPERIFQSLSGLEELRIVQGGLAVIQERLLWNLAKLKFLDLSHNHLERLNSRVFEKLIELEVIRLDHNELETIPGDIFPTHLHQLRNSNVDFDGESSLTNLHLRRVDKTANITLSQIHLHNNPWACHCTLSKQIYLLQNKIVNVSTLTCHSGESLIDLNEVCRRRIFDITIILFIVLILLVVTLVLYYQQSIKFVHQMCLSCVSGKQIESDLRYDAFITYSYHDEDFIVNELLPTLESAPNSFKVCVHKRNLVPEEFIEEQIVEAIQHSRRTIVFMTRHFLTSHGFRQAFEKSLVENRTRLIVILADDVKMEGELKSPLRTILNCRKHLQKSDANFWQKLLDAMPQQNARMTAQQRRIHDNERKIQMAILREENRQLEVKNVADVEL